MEARVATAISGSSDDSPEVHELDVNRIYLDVVGGEKKRRVYGLGSQALSLYQDCNSATSQNLSAVTDRAAEECFKLLEEEKLRMRENQERILQERVEAKVQRLDAEVKQHAEQEVSRLTQESDDRFKSMEDRWFRMMSEMALYSRSSGDPTLSK
ncbi:uncharacterized protein LOC132605328 [Lycium barbarum]|uniref:uncharacterized protein LOC132605328 n=1 Tax=Lycium barbarum TaxID=112863 RepID=UPI00293EC8BD|nr:uncharacterized protein LOC132605328 [Lycium barbarum]XP_060174494.1 uncharacterized protein LOC132605328 [Lycium barbarum]XP_060174495.1 uncharacterized protein LOC132605328 [Lycium barbarum]